MHVQVHQSFLVAFVLQVIKLYSHSFVTRFSTDYTRCKQFIWCELLNHFYIIDTRVAAMYWL
jgi:hypothetical protein